MAVATLQLDPLKVLSVDELGTFSPADLTKKKSVRQNSKDLHLAYQTARNIFPVLEDVQAIFVEVPHGSQSARAMASYGVCIGLLGALRAQGSPFFEVTANEVKLATVGKKTASKEEMISWATSNHPEASWPYRTQGGEQHIVAKKAEHSADAVGAIYAGIQSTAFQQLLPFLQQKVS